jgi:hypothetical protein
MNLWAIAVATLATFVLIRALLIRSASIDGESMMRDEEPGIYWSVLTCNLAIVLFLLWVGFKGA